MFHRNIRQYVRRFCIVYTMPVTTADVNRLTGVFLHAAIAAQSSRLARVFLLTV